MTTDNDNLSMHDLPANERPRERLLLYGPSHLSNADLLAVILRTGSADENVLHLAERVLTECGGLRGLAQVSPTVLGKIPGIGPAKASQILALVEFAKRFMTQQPIESAIISSAEDAMRLVMDMRYLPQEHVRIILLDNARRVIAVPTVYIGTLQASVLRVAELFREAIIRNSPAVIIAHNHPAGEVVPSPEDVEITRTLIAAGKLLDIQVLDHLIIGQSDWVSLKNLKLSFPEY